MPKLPVVSGDETIRVLVRLGFVEMRQRGSHVVLRRGTDGCVVPKHRELNLGTLTGILKQANVSTDDFVRLLKS
jgi:predicted RNA binding protein YcfA (HicA-like mRNA interferase family)